VGEGGGEGGKSPVGRGVRRGRKKARNYDQSANLAGIFGGGSRAVQRRVVCLLCVRGVVGEGRWPWVEEGAGKGRWEGDGKATIGLHDNRLNFRPSNKF
jgi:hypothetical protein